MAGWGLVGAATARAPQETLEELVAERIAAAEAQRKQQAEALKQQLDVGRFGLESERVGIDRRGADRADQYLGIAQEQDTRAGQKFATDQTYTSEDRALEAARRAEQAAAVGSAPAHLRPTLNFRRIGLGDVSPRDAAMTPQAQDDAALKLRQTAPPRQGNGGATTPAPRPARPLSAIEAGKISELNTSLNDLKTLREALGTTGAESKIGAWLPNVVTEMTGIGAEAKAKQATIDRVKQVIGKALEGGVLRKEDEMKYEKILPTVGDPPENAKAKLDGLEAAIRQRLETQMQALDDAGYDVSRFQSRMSSAGSSPREAMEAFGGGSARSASSAAPTQVLAQGPGVHTFANGQTWRVSADGKTAERIK